jgi:hypothetical protein
MTKLCSSLTYSQSELDVLDSCLSIKSYCTSGLLINVLSDKFLIEELQIYTNRINHPMYCESEEKYFLKLVVKADELSTSGELETAIELYKRAIKLNDFDIYPKNQLKKLKNN